MARDRVPGLNRDADWSGIGVVVAGIGVSGFAAADALLGLGATVTVVDGKADDAARDRARVLEALGATVVLGTGSSWDGETLPDGADVVVTSPGWKPSSPLLVTALAAGLEVWGEVELAWRLRPTTGAAPWLAITGTNGKTTTVRMLTSMLNAAGLKAVAAGNVGTPLLEVVMAETGSGVPRYDVLAVELSSFQLHWSSSLRCHSAVVLNVAPDHVDWHGDLDGYARAKGKIYTGVQVACVYNAADPVTERLVEEAEVTDGARAIGFTLGTPGPSMLGVVSGLLVDRAFLADRHNAAVELANVADVVPNAPHNVANALAAAALARAFGVPATAIRDGLAAFRPDAHRIADVATVAGIRYIDDSKATNPHAAAASLGAYDRIVWIAGGLAKGATFDDLIEGAAGRLKGVVLIGADRAEIAAALARHAPDVPVTEVDAVDTGAMAAIVAAAAQLAEAGDTILLAPACASMDMFANYGERGDRFAAAVLELAGGSGTTG
ncbi:UDP-N-acetylmuramoyl-L-alanine--D-glutamate ligase [Sporichthya sp.]|uniref:UDP-N-acetylmuramoyl-L-alanine--D-glutamate ligase n=1 Tax=Sporichthya sp. TaxID=65475 RepID=UPI00185D41B1|nr:UDP-N-acetylmuramoyl-L-alanine--D-glutamate ligase [Sporichthya sp.]